MSGGDGQCGCTWEGMDLPGPEVDDERAVATLNPCLLHQVWADQRPESALRMLAARAVAHCPRDLAEVLCRELGIPMPEGFVEKPSALDAWATPCAGSSPLARRPTWSRSRPQS